jgi:hypothetical protein
VAPALEAAGFSVTCVAQDDDLAAACAKLGPNAVNCYVQLPVEIRPGGESALQRVHELLEQGLLTRFETARKVLPVLAENAAVVLVSGNLLTSDPVPDDQRARMALLRVLGHSIIADAGELQPWVTVVDHQRSPADIAGIAKDRGKRRLQMIAEYAERNEDLSYDDWKLALMSLSSSEV